ncbi:MAG: ACT domain-containing protein, partial [Planctomycetota bacterium]
GVSIVTTAGPWTPGEPDRGPDARRATAAYPHLPEPDEEHGIETSAIITAVGRNSPGVLAGITGAIASLNCNVLDVSQKMVEGYFHMILTVDLGGQTSFSELKDALEGMSSRDKYVVRVMNERVFRFMHRL